MNAWAICASIAFGLVSASTLESDPFAPPQIQLQFDVATNSNTGKVLDADVSRFIQDIVNASEVKVASLAFVRSNGEAEFGAWSIRSEDGDQMTTDVNLFSTAEPRR